MLDKLPPEYDSRVKAMEVPGSGRSLHGRTWHEGMGRIESGTPPKTNMDTQNDGLEEVTFFQHGNSWYLC